MILAVAKLGVKLERVQNAAVVRLTGEVDAQSAPDLEKALRTARGEVASVIVADLSGLGYLGSAGWGMLLASAKGIEGDGKQFVLAGMSKEIRKVFEMLHFHRVLRSSPDVETAIRLSGGS